MAGMASNFYLHDVATNVRHQNSRQIAGIYAQQNRVSSGLWQALGRHNLVRATNNQLSNYCHPSSSSKLRKNHLGFIADGISSSALYGTGFEMMPFASRASGTGTGSDMVDTTSNADSGVNSLCAALDNLKGKGKMKKAKAKGNTQLNQNRRDIDEDLIMMRIHSQ